MDPIVQRIVETSTLLTDLCGQFDVHVKELGNARPFMFDSTLRHVQSSTSHEELIATLQGILDRNRIRQSALSKLAAAGLSEEERKALYL